MTLAFVLLHIFALFWFWYWWWWWLQLW